MTPTDDDGPAETLFGWCSPRDQYHDLCPVEYTAPFGVLKRCSCPAHEEGDDACPPI